MADLLFLAPGGSGAAALLVTASSTLQSRTPSGLHRVSSLHLNAASRSAADDALVRAESVLYFGHARKDSLGEPPDILVDAANIHRISGVLVAISCYAAGGLGALFLGDSSRAFLGFDDLIRIPLFAPHRAIEGFAEGLTLLVRGGSIADARDQLRQQLLAAATDYLTYRYQYGITDSEALDARDMLRSNTVALVAYGATTRSL